jgi:hypothetical protein
MSTWHGEQGGAEDTWTAQELAQRPPDEAQGLWDWEGDRPETPARGLGPSGAPYTPEEAPPTPTMPPLESEPPRRHGRPDWWGRRDDQEEAEEAEETPRKVRRIVPYQLEEVNRVYLLLGRKPLGYDQDALFVNEVYIKLVEACLPTSETNDPLPFLRLGPEHTGELVRRIRARAAPPRAMPRDQRDPEYEGVGFFTSTPASRAAFQLRMLAAPDMPQA